MANPRLFIPSTELANADPNMRTCYLGRRHDWVEAGCDTFEFYRNGNVKQYRQKWYCGRGCKTDGYEYVAIDGMGYRSRVGSFHYEWAPEYKQLSAVPNDVLTTERYMLASGDINEVARRARAT